MESTLILGDVPHLNGWITLYPCSLQTQESQMEETTSASAVSLFILHRGEECWVNIFSIIACNQQVCICLILSKLADRGSIPMNSNTVTTHFRLPVVVHTTNTNAVIGLGETHNFSCNVSNALQRQWIHYPPNGPYMYLNVNTDVDIVITPDYELQLRDIQFDSEGRYECITTNNLGSETIRHSLKVVGESFH